MSNSKTTDNHTDCEHLILKAAEEEFIRKGFNGARTTAIAERAGVTHAMLHYYFRTKENLFDKVLETKSSEMRSVMLGFACASDLPLPQRIEQGMRNHFNFLVKNPGLPLFIINELSRENSKVAGYIQMNREAASLIALSLQSAIDDCAEHGECRRVNAMMLMLDIVSLNASLFAGAPLLNAIFHMTPENRENFLSRRLEENIQTVLNKLKP